MLERSVVGKVREDAQLDLRVICGQQDEARARANSIPGSQIKARRQSCWRRRHGPRVLLERGVEHEQLVGRREIRSLVPKYLCQNGGVVSGG